jgi:hypothetical protein
MNMDVHEEKYRVSVIEIHFAYDNQDVIERLTTRGHAIASASWEKVKKTEKELDELIKQNYETYSEPVCAFITFERSDFADLAIEYSKQIALKKHKYKDFIARQLIQETIFNEVPVFKQAQDPTNIIWENRHIKGKEFYKRLAVSIAIILFALFISALFNSSLTKENMELSQLYKPVNCEAVFETYGTSFSDKIKYAYFEKLIRDIDENAPVIGSLQCFCISEATNGVDSSKVYTFEDVEGNTKSEPVCQALISNIENAAEQAWISSQIIVVANILLRYLIIYVFEKTGFSTETTKMTYITMAIFMSQFFNTALQGMLVNSNLFFFNGNNPDFNTRWFKNVGDPIVASLSTQMVLPIFMNIFSWWTSAMMRNWDSFRAKDGYSTCKTTRQGYINLYAGPTFALHYKYSTILNIVFITMMFGTAMPVLFPIALGTFMILYVIEKGLLYYQYQEPPKYDDILNTTALNVMKFAPSLMLGFAYWMFSSKQLIENDTLIPKFQKNMPYNSGHWVKDALNPWTVWETNTLPAIALYVAFWISLLNATFANAGKDEEIS